MSPRVCSSSCPLSQWCHSTISSSVIPFSSYNSIFPSIRVFFNESALCIRCPKYWSFSISICPSNECSGMISFRIGLLDLLAFQGTLKSLLQSHSLKASILRCSYAHILLGYTYLGLLCLSRSYLSKVAVPISVLISPVWTLLLFCNLVIALTC